MLAELPFGQALTGDALGLTARKIAAWPEKAEDWRTATF